MSQFLDFWSSYLPVYKQSSITESSNQAVPYLLLTIVFSLVVYIVESYLDRRQLNRFSGPKCRLPKELESFVTSETFVKSVAYGKDKFTFKIFEGCYSIIEGLSMICLGYLPFMWDSSKSLSTSILVAVYPNQETSQLFNEIMITWVFIVLTTLLDTVIKLPFSLYSTFVVEQRHGFNKSTLALFFQDKLLTLALTFVLSMPILSIVIWLVRLGGEYFYFYVWLFLLVVSVILMTIYPTLIAPLFNKYTKLEDGEVKTAIENLSKRVSFPLTQVFQVDGSRRSAHSNAYFYGFFKSKRIVLYDTLLKQVNLDELLAILGHEIGHWKLWHTVQGFFISQLYTFCLFLAFSFVQHTPDLFTAFGFHYTVDQPMPVFVGLMLFSQTFWSPVDKALSLLMTVNSRRNEFQADAFASQLGMGEALGTGLIKISIENLDNLVPDQWYSSYHYSHPPLVERLRAIRANTASHSEQKKVN
mmetsp:Transcript_27667/g.38113  ORF Transcript_27667/g.38113 Transcript_27667/m.38113 type:complete len:472 (-) Transcript_27667:1008-2423(-)